MTLIACLLDFSPNLIAAEAAEDTDTSDTRHSAHKRETPAAVGAVLLQWTEAAGAVGAARLVEEHPDTAHTHKAMEQL